MKKTDSLSRFLEAQEEGYQIALSEIKQGRKRSHWMWYIFPQILGLGNSETSRFYAIKDLHEASTFLGDPILGGRLRDISKELLKLETADANLVFGTPDHLKLCSSMTLFSMVPNADPLFQQVLDKFFGGAKDKRTLKIVSS